MKRKFDICRDFDAWKCWELGCDNVEERLIYNDNSEIVDEELFCNGDFTNIETCPLKRHFEQ